MQNIAKYIIQKGLPVLFFIMMASCQDSFLDVLPKGKLIAEKTADYDMLLNTVSLVNMGTYAQALMGDEIASVSSYYSGMNLRDKLLFQWADEINQDNEDAAEMTVPMQNLYLYNKIINEVMDSKEGTETEKKSLRAEALAGRAWTYFLLINYYGKPFDASTASSDPGFPIMTRSDITSNKYTRVSVQNVYDFIIDDLTKAIPDLPELTHRLRMSKPAAEGLLGKVYAFMGNFESALKAFNEAFADINEARISLELYNYNTAFTTGGSFYPVSATNGPTYPTAPNNTESLYGKQFTSAIPTTRCQVVLSPKTLELFGSNDMRLNFYTPYPPNSNVLLPLGTKRRFGPTTVQIGVLLPDLYLLRAECKARMNDLSGAVKDLETLRAKRMPVGDAAIPNSIASNKLSLIQYILEERIREFAEQGFRWFDMRRLSVDPLFTSPTYTHVIYSAEGSIVDTYTLNAPNRLTLRIPPKVISQNPGMENNP
jgi:tetratricopeptide (TPR) repeat protein